MAKEIERTFLVKDDSFKKSSIRTINMLQGYLNREPERTVRIRIADKQAFLTVKGKTAGFVREEFEYEIPYKDGMEMLKMCQGRIIDKTRYIVPYKGLVWEVDEYHGDLAPLIVTEVELDNQDDEISIPPFAGQEVSGDPRYFNSQL